MFGRRVAVTAVGPIFNGAAVPAANTARAGDRLTYTIAVTNGGGTAGTANLSEQVPEGTTFAGPAGTWIGCAVTPTPTDHPRGVCTWTGSIPAHNGTAVGSVAVLFGVLVLNPLTASVSPIRTMVTATGPGGTSICPSVDACTVVTPLTASWTMTKVASRNGTALADGAIAREGATITSTVTATALRGTVTGLQLTDDLSGVIGAGSYRSGTVTVAGGAPTPISPTGNPGTYWLRESKAPAGANLLAKDVQFVVAANGAVTFPQVSVAVVSGTVTIRVVDTRPFALPLSGGAGTTWISVVGLALIIGAAGLLLVRRRSTPA